MPAAPGALERRRRRRQRTGRWWFPQPFLLLATLGAAVVLLALGLLRRGDRIAPGVVVLDLPLGGQTVTEAVETLEAHWAERLITLTAEDDAWTLPPAALGLVLDARATALAAHQRGRGLGALVDVLLDGRELEVAPTWHFDADVAGPQLRELAWQVEVAPAPAGVRIADGRAEAAPPVDGRVLDQVTTILRLQQEADAVFEHRRFDLSVRAVAPAVTSADIDGAVALANQRLARALPFEVYDPVSDEVIAWEEAPAGWGDLVAVSVVPGPPVALDWGIDTGRALAWLNRGIAALGTHRYLEPDEAIPAIERAVVDGGTAVHVRAYHRERRHVVRPGDTLSGIAVQYGVPYPWIQAANPGVGDALSTGQELVVPSPDVFLPLPVVEGKRIVVSLSAQRMRVYEDGEVRWDWPVSTGIESSPTAPGVFQVQSHEPNAYASNWDLWMPHFMGIYQPVPDTPFMNGFHGFPTRGGANLLWTGSLGAPVTYGCVLVDSARVTELYDWAEEGVVVEIVP